MIVMNDKITLLAVLTVGTAFTFLWLMLCKERLRIKWYAALPIAVLHTICGVLCVKVFAVVEVGFDMSKAGSMSLFGGIFILPLFYYLGAKLTRRKPAEVFDVFTICMIFTLMCARFNCIFSGCCAGKVIPGMSIRWPTRELEILFYIVLLFWLGRPVRQSKRVGMIYPLYMIAYGAFRFLTEWLRAYETASPLHRGHVWGLITLALGLSIYYTQREKIQKRGGKQRR